MTLPTLVASITVADREFRVLEYSWSQALDSIDTLRCGLDAAEFELEPAGSFLEKEARFSLALEGTEHAVAFAGDVVGASDVIDEAGARQVELTIAAPTWRLATRTQSQIHQKKTLQELVKQTLEEAGVHCAVEWSGDAAESQLDYVVQFEESDWAFLQRVLAEHGVSCGYQTRDDDALLWFSDDPGRAAGSAIELLFQTHFGHDPAAHTVSELQQQRRLRPDRSRVTAYDPLKASLQIAADAGEGSSEIYVPLSRAATPELASARAASLVASYRGRERAVTGATRYLGLYPGCAISIEGHPYPALNGEYLIEAVRSLGRSPREFAYLPESELRTIEFDAVPLTARRVPTRRAEARTIGGVQTAITTGASGEEIHTSENGEVTLLMHWDRKGKRDETSSRFIRTSQLPTGGSMLLPRVGWEVVVGYHEGDVDRPMVMSRLYNAETMPPYSLPEGALRSALQTATTPGGGSSNEIRMDDTKGNEQMMFNASRDMSLQVGNNTTQSVGNDLGIEVGANHKHTVIGSAKDTVGSNQKVQVSGNQTVSITSLGVEQVDGAHSASIGGNRIQMIGGDHRRTVDGSSELTVSGNQMTAVLGSVTTETEASFTHDVGAALIQVSKGSRSVVIGGAHSETTGGAKVLIAKGTRSLEVGSLAETVGGALVLQVKGNRSDSATLGWSETAGGQQKIEANNVTIEGQLKVSLTMGGASITLTPAMVSISGAAVKLDGDLVEMAPMIMDN